MLQQQLQISASWPLRAAKIRASPPPQTARGACSLHSNSSRTTASVVAKSSSIDQRITIPAVSRGRMLLPSFLLLQSNEIRASSENLSEPA